MVTRLERGTLAAELDDGGLIVLERCDPTGIEYAAVHIDADEARWLALAALPALIAPYNPGKEPTP